MATLTVTITEAVTLNGVDRGVTNTLTTAITGIDHRILELSTSFIEYIRFGATVGAGTYKNTTVPYVRITNLDSSAYLTVRLRGADYTSFLKVPAKGSILLTDQTMDAFGDITSSGTLANLVSIGIKTSVASDAEIFVGVV